MSPARYSLAAVSVVALLMWAAFASAPLAQSESEEPTRAECERQRENNEELDPRCRYPRGLGRLCRVRWQEQTYGGDTLATTAVFNMTMSAPQADGSAVYMGRGPANIVFTPGGGCTATRGGNSSVTMMAIVSSEDGQTAAVDIGAFMEDSFEVAVSCPLGHNSEMDVSASAPPTVTLSLQDGASASYDDSSTHSWGQVGGQRGTVTLEFCAPERRGN